LLADGLAWDLVVLRKLAGPLSAVASDRKAGRLVWHGKAWSSAAYCRWPGDWESLHESGARWFARMRKDLRRFARGGGSAERFTGLEAVRRLDTVAGIEACSWKGREGVARLQPGPGQELLRTAFLTLGEQVELWLGFIEGRPVAFGVNFVTPDRLLLYQGSYDERERRLGAGSVLDYLAIERAWEQGVREYDYLGGDEPYKLERTTELRPLYHVAGHARTLRCWLAYGLLLAPRWNLRGMVATRAIYRRAKHFARVPWRNKRLVRSLAGFGLVAKRALGKEKGPASAEALR
jgi:hypothetical protein